MALTMRSMLRFAAAAVASAAAVSACDLTTPSPATELAAPAARPAPAIENPYARVGLRLVGQNDLQARSAYQPVVHRYGDRRILFVGHHAGEALNPITGLLEQNGLSILDVTNPATPKYLAHLPPTGDEASGTQHVQICDGSTLPNADRGKVYAIRTNGQLGYEVVDVTDPEAPKF